MSMQLSVLPMVLGLSTTSARVSNSVSLKKIKKLLLFKCIQMAWLWQLVSKMAQSRSMMFVTKKKRCIWNQVKDHPHQSANLPSQTRDSTSAHPGRIPIQLKCSPCISSALALKSFTRTLSIVLLLITSVVS